MKEPTRLEQEYAGKRERFLVSLVRTIHGAITLFFLTCIVYVYYAAFTNQVSTWAYLAAASIVIEGLVVAINGGNCPLGGIHRRVGDDKTFFELFLPKAAAKRAVPFLGVVAGIGILLLFF